MKMLRKIDLMLNSNLLKKKTNGLLLPVITNIYLIKEFKKGMIMLIELKNKCTKIYLNKLKSRIKQSKHRDKRTNCIMVKFSHSSNVCKIVNTVNNQSTNALDRKKNYKEITNYLIFNKEEELKRKREKPLMLSLLILLKKNRKRKLN